MPPVLAAVTAVGAASGFAATATAISTVVSYVGMGLTVVGAITGNAKLTKIGSIMGLAGGIGSAVGAANGITVSSINADAAKSASDAASNAAADAKGSFETHMNDGIAAQDTSQSGAATSDFGTGKQSSSGNALFGQKAPVDTTSKLGVDRASATMAPAKSVDTAVASAAPDTTAVNGSPAAVTPGVTAPAAVDAATPGSSFSFMDLVKSPSAVQLAGSALSGMSAGKAAEEKQKALDKQAAQTRADKSAAALLYSKRS